jgi:hypothetical protein
MILISRRGVL